MTLRLSLLLGLISLVPCTLQAQILQDKLEVFAGYSYVRFHNTPSTSQNGWEVSGQYNWKPWLGGVGDVSGVYGQYGGISIAIHTYLAGPEVNYPWRISPFAHLLLGAGHRSGSGITDTSFAYALGGGADARLGYGFSWRVIQYDYLPTHFFGVKQHNRRISTGIVFRF